MDARSAMQRLKQGNARFCRDEGGAVQRDQPRRDELATGQRPFAAVLTCSDSRVVPEFIFDIGLGELFVTRVAGSVASTETIASLEYSVEALQTKLIVVMGHESCGALQKALEGGYLSEHLEQLLELTQPAVAASGPEITSVAHNHSVLTAERLAKKSGILRRAVETDGVVIAPAYYELSGKVVWL